MKRTGILSILCLALGAVQAEAQSRSAVVSCYVQSGAKVQGQVYPVLSVLPNVARGSDIHVLMGSTGTSTMTIGNQPFVVPLSNVSTILSGRTKGRIWCAHFAVPNDPALVGMTLNLMTVTVGASGALNFSALVPFGPIIEDSIQ